MTEKYVAVYIDIKELEIGATFLVAYLISERPKHKTIVIVGNHGMYDPEYNQTLMDEIGSILGEGFGFDPRDEPREWVAQYLAEGKMRWQFVAEALLLPEYTLIEWNE
jgi:hypothetical protein